MKKDKLLIVVGAITVFATAVLICNKRMMCGATQIKVGVLSFMTGTYAQMGHDFVNGIKLAEEELCDDSAYNTKRLSFKVLVEDGKAEAKVAISAMQKLLFSGIDCAIIAGDNQVPISAPLLVKEKIPSIATIISNSQLLKYNNPETWVFKNCTSIGAESAVTASYAVCDLNLTRVAVFRMQSEFGIESEAAFVDAYRSAGGNVVCVETFDENGVDFRSVIAKAFEKSPDSFFVSGYGPAYCTIINQIREAGFDGIILTVNSIINPETKNVVKHFEDIIYASFVMPESKEYADFADNYKNKYGVSPSIYSAYGYDSFKLLFDAYGASKDYKSCSVRNELMAVKNRQILMGTISFKENGDAEIPLAISRMNKDGSSTIINRK